MSPFTKPPPPLRRDSIADISSDGRKERVQFDKITARVSRLCYGLDPEHVDPAAITMKVIAGVYQGVTTIQLDDLVRVFSSPNLHQSPTNVPSNRLLRPPPT